MRCIQLSYYNTFMYGFSIHLFTLLKNVILLLEFRTSGANEFHSVIALYIGSRPNRIEYYIYIFIYI